jgi:hypothetical protein
MVQELARDKLVKQDFEFFIKIANNYFATNE